MFHERQYIAHDWGASSSLIASTKPDLHVRYVRQQSSTVCHAETEGSTGERVVLSARSSHPIHHTSAPHSTQIGWRRAHESGS